MINSRRAYLEYFAFLLWGELVVFNTSYLFVLEVGLHLAANELPFLVRGVGEVRFAIGFSIKSNVSGRDQVICESVRTNLCLKSSTSQNPT